MPQYSQSAYRHGDYVAKYAVLPLGAAQRKLVDVKIKDDDPVNIISQQTRDFHLKNKVSYTF